MNEFVTVSASKTVTAHEISNSISNPDDYRDTQLKLKGIKKISGIRNTNPLAYAYLVKSLQLLNENGLYTESVL